MSNEECSERDDDNQDEGPTSTGSMVKQYMDITASVARDVLSHGPWITDFAFTTTQHSVRVGFRFGQALTGALTAVAAAAGGGEEAVAVGVLGMAGLEAARAATAYGLELGRQVTHTSISTTDQMLEQAYGAPTGETVRLAFGTDAGNVMLFVRRLTEEGIISPPDGMDYAETTEAIRNLSWLQYTGGFAQDLAAVDVVPPDMSGAKRYLPFAISTYGYVALRFLQILPVINGPTSDYDAIRALTKINPSADNLIIEELAGSTYRPGYVVLVDNDGSAIVICARGTIRLHDVLTDLACEAAPYCGGFAHDGMLRAAQILKNEIMDTINEALAKRPKYDLVICGHSLGGGLATLLAHLIGPHIDIDGDKRYVRCFSYASPAVLSLELARNADHVTSLVVGTDMVPRFGLATTIEIRKVLGLLHHSPNLMEEIRLCRDDVHPSSIEERVSYARATYQSIVEEANVQHKLYPAGRVLWTPEPTTVENEHNNIYFRQVNVENFSSIALSGSAMFSSHMPQMYVKLLM